MAVVAVESHALLAKLAQMRSAGNTTIAGDVAPTKVIGDHQHNVGRGGGGEEGRGAEE